jgi:serine/threonine protein kinase
LNTYGIIHRDLKLENIMMTDDSEKSIPKLVDFGLSAITGPDQVIQGAVGTVAYAAPEIFQGAQYDKSVDVWSLGIIFYALLMGYLPYDSEDKKQIVKMLLNDPVPFDSEWNDVSPHAFEIVQQMLKKNKEERCSIEDVMGCAWLNGGTHKPIQSNGQINEDMFANILG